MSEDEIKPVCDKLSERLREIINGGVDVDQIGDEAYSKLSHFNGQMVEAVYEMGEEIDRLTAERDAAIPTPLCMSALASQVGGDHYRGGGIQPVQYIEANGLGFLEGCCIKRLTRHAREGGKGRQDIEKAIHELQLLLELRYGREA